MRNIFILLTIITWLISISNKNLLAQDKSENIPISKFYINISIPYSYMSSSEFDGIQFRTTETKGNIDGFIFLPFFDPGIGYEISIGGKTKYSKDNDSPIFKATSAEISYIHTTHKAFWNPINGITAENPLLEFNSSFSSLDLTTKFYLSDEPFMFYLLFGFQLTSSLTIENGSYLVVNNKPTNYGNVTFHGGLFHSGIWNIRGGLGATIYIIKNFMIDFTYSSRNLCFDSFEGIMGERDTQDPTTKATGGLFGSMYITYTVLQFGLTVTF